MKLTVVGTGYVGLVSGVCLAESGHDVICVDIDKDKVNQLRRLEVPIYEPGLEQLLVRNAGRSRIGFTTDMKEGVRHAEVLVVAVGTPPLPDGSADLSQLRRAADEIAAFMDKPIIIMVKSTVPVGTNELIRDRIRALSAISFEIASVPEFLREGSAVADTFQADRIVIGTESERAANILGELHRPFTERLILTDIRSAEMAKYASNAMLAAKISLINEMANLCERLGADVTEVAEAMGCDRRIGPHFLAAGAGYGGSCFPKDTKALIRTADEVGVNLNILKSVDEINDRQWRRVVEKTQDALGDLTGKSIAVWGLSFKPNTDDVRNSTALKVVPELIRLGAVVRVYDPVALESFRRLADDPAIGCYDDPYEAARGCDAVCLLTDWKEFAAICLPELENVMRTPILIDGRNLFQREQFAGSRFTYKSIGRPDAGVERRTE